MTRISAHGERKLKLRRASLAKETQREARRATQEQVQSPISNNVEGGAADRSTMDTNPTHGNGVAEPDTHDTNGNGNVDTSADGAQDEPGQVANNTNATNGVADGVADADGEGETNDAA